MATDPVLRMLGLARRAGKLAYGDELVREACFDHKTRCVFIAGDAGANAAKKAAFYADKANVPCVTLPHGKLELGSAIGKAGCAMCAVADIGMAAAAVNKLDYAASGGIHSPEGVVKAILAGASAVEICSVLYQNSATIIEEYIRFLNLWMDRKGMETISQFKGILNVNDPKGVNTFERTQFLKYFSSHE